MWNPAGSAKGCDRLNPVVPLVLVETGKAGSSDNWGFRRKGTSILGAFSLPGQLWTENTRNRWPGFRRWFHRTSTNDCLGSVPLALRHRFIGIYPRTDQSQAEFRQEKSGTKSDPVMIPGRDLMFLCFHHPGETDSWRSQRPEPLSGPRPIL